MDAPEREAPFLTRRSTQVGATVVIGVAFAGLLIGFGEGVRPEPFEPEIAEAAVPDHDVVPATAYADFSARLLGPNRDFRSRLDRLARVETPPEQRADPALKRASLERRARTRAFNGAPPVVPHAVDTRSAASCLACHREGISATGLFAPRIPHAEYASCLQCHAEAAPQVPGGPPEPPASSFVGLAAPESGPRAWTGAPPRIPHSTWMREDCLSCHGPTGWKGMQTTHPERKSCLQCHAPDASLEQTPQPGGSLFLPPLEVARGTPEETP